MQGCLPLCAGRKSQAARRSHQVRMVVVQGTSLECLDSIPVNHFLQVIIIPYLDLLVLMRSTEAIEEVHHRKVACDGGQMCNSCQVHCLLYAVGSQHCETGLTTCHNVGMVAEDG